MDFLKILKSLEELIFEAAGWILFYPLTVFRVVRHPLQMMAYSDREQAIDEDQADKAYDDALSPPLLLLVTILLASLISQAAHLPPEPHQSAALKFLNQSFQNAALFHALLFSTVPLVSAASLLNRQGKRLSRHTLRGPFYAQCYLAVPCAAVVNLGIIFIQRPDLPGIAGFAVVAFGTAWFLWVQSAWYAKELVCRRVKGLWVAIWAMGWAFAGILAVVVPLALL